MLLQVLQINKKKMKAIKPFIGNIVKCKTSAFHNSYGYGLIADIYSDIVVIVWTKRSEPYSYTRKYLDSVRLVSNIFRIEDNNVIS